jgi:hypothetical protein
MTFKRIDVAFSYAVSVGTHCALMGTLYEAGGEHVSSLKRLPASRAAAVLGRTPKALEVRVGFELAVQREEDVQRLRERGRECARSSGSGLARLTGASSAFAAP